MELQANRSRQRFLFAAAMSAGAAMMLRPGLGRVANSTDPRRAEIVATTIGIDTHNHIDILSPPLKCPARKSICAAR